jgi:hypothetical protein
LTTSELEQLLVDEQYEKTELGHFKMLVLPAVVSQRKTMQDFQAEASSEQEAQKLYFNYLRSLPTPITINKDAPVKEFGIKEGSVIECILDMGSCHMKRTLASQGPVK